MNFSQLSKKIISLILSLIFILTLGCSTVFATDSSSEIDEFNYIRFNPTDTRIASDGSFDFRFSYNLRSDTFIANSTSISINTCAHLSRLGTGEITTSRTHQFCVVLKHDGIVDKEVGRYYGYADGVYGGLTFTNIKKGDKYYFTMSPTDGNFHLGAYYFEGYGDVSPVTIK